MLREVEVGKLSLGMYVAELDRPWLETPFTLQGFYLRSPEDISNLADYCDVVKVDPRRYDPRIAALSHAGGAERARTAPVPRRSRPAQRSAGTATLRHTAYNDVATVEDELPAARRTLVDSAATFEGFWQDLSARRRVRIANLRAAVNPLVDSILRNKDALVTLMRVQHLDRNTHEHCMALAVWGSLLARQLGLPPEQIKALALACSLVDIGKIRLPKQLLYKPGTLNGQEYAIVKSHVDYSLQMLDGMGEANDDVIATVRWHHERMDGGGYPDGLRGDDIPVFARIAGIVDSYDAMISPRTYAPMCSSYEALVELQDHSPAHFQTELVEQFAQAVGLFPNGALVELSTGEVGVVCGQNAGRRLRPKVMLILDTDKRRRDELVIIDLKQSDQHQMRIARELARNEYGIDAAEYFL